MHCSKELCTRDNTAMATTIQYSEHLTTADGEMLVWTTEKTTTTRIRQHMNMHRHMYT